MVNILIIESICVTSCVSTNIDEFKEDINVYPNPANNFINLDGDL